ncbi:hypothetical protein CUPL110328_18395 [Cupriavidus plantarum]|nr:hypothetical protein LMG26296_04693 [Cupriavidus plantarum]SMR67982.1 hypothetical protein SAMN05421735_2892 [Cupriavidus plantarum]
MSNRPLSQQIQMSLDFGMSQEPSLHPDREEGLVSTIDRESAVVLQFPVSRKRAADQMEVAEMEEAMLLQRILRRSAGIGAWF